MSTQLEESKIHMTVEEIPCADIFSDDDFNCRGDISAVDVVDLAKDIDQNGLQQPIVVQKNPRSDLSPLPWRIIAGHRRFKACAVVLKKSHIPCVIKTENISEEQALVLNFTENLHRKQLNILQEAKVCQRFLALGLNEYKIAQRLGQSRGWVQVRCMLLAMPDEVKEAAASGVYTQENIRTIYEYPAEKRLDAAKTIKEIKESAKKRTEGKKELVKAPFNPELKKRRGQADIVEMQNHIYETLGGNGFATRLLGWVTGYVSDGDIYAELKKVADKVGRPYTPPSESK